MTVDTKVKINIFENRRPLMREYLWPWGAYRNPIDHPITLEDARLMLDALRALKMASERGLDKQQSL